MRQALDEYAKTFFVLLNEAHKLDVYAKRWDLTASAYPNMDEDRQQELSDRLTLPDDVLNDILEGDTTEEDIKTLKDVLDGN